MTQPASMNVQSRLSMALTVPPTPIVASAYTEAYDIVSESLTSVRQHVDASGIRGTRQHSKERVVQGIDVVGGNITFQPGTAMAVLLLPRILGSFSVHTASFAEKPPAFDICVDKIAQRHIFYNCMCDKATFHSKPNQPLDLSMDVKGISESVSATALAAITTTLEIPWIFSQGVITLNSVVRQITEFSLTIDNSLDVRYTNSQVATDISPKDQHIHLTCTAPYTSDTMTDLYGLGTVASAATLVFTNGTSILTFTMAALQFEDKTPNANGRGEIFLPIRATCRKSSTTDALAFTTAP